MMLPARVSSTMVFSDALIPRELTPTISSWPIRSERLILATTCVQSSCTVNASVGAWFFVTFGEGVRFAETGVADPDPSATVGLAVESKPQPANTAMLIIAQPRDQARRPCIARRTAPRSRSVHRMSLLAAAAVRTLGLSHPGADATQHPHLACPHGLEDNPCRASPA